MVNWAKFFLASDIILWFAFGIMFGSFLTFFTSMGKITQVHKRIFHGYILALVGFATILYFIMASNAPALGEDPYKLKVFFLVEWLVPIPVIVISLLHLARVPRGESFPLVVVNILGIIAFFAALFFHPDASSAYSYCLIIMGFLLFLPVVFQMLFLIRGRVASAVGEAASATYTTLTIFTVVLWVLYAFFFTLRLYGIGWIPEEYGTLIYVVLDLFAKSVFGFIFLNSREAIDEATEEGGYTTVPTAPIAPLAPPMPMEYT